MTFKIEAKSGVIASFRKMPNTQFLPVPNSIGEFAYPIAQDNEAAVGRQQNVSIVVDMAKQEKVDVGLLCQALLGKATYSVTCRTLENTFRLFVFPSAVLGPLESEAYAPARVK